MYYLYGSKYNIKNIEKLTCKFNKGSLAHNYNSFLSIHSIFEKPVDWHGIKFINAQRIKEFSSRFWFEKQEFFIENTGIIQDKLDSGFYNNSLNELKKTQPEFYFLASLVIKLVIINRLKSHTNGTTNETLGVSCMNIKDEYVKQDFFELMFHQLVHMLLFISDRATLQISDSLKNTEIDTDVKHVNGGYKFPIYLLYHSLVVGVEVLLYRINTNSLDFNGNVHGSTEGIYNKCSLINSSLQPHGNKFTAAGQEILFRVNEFLNNFKTQMPKENVA